METFGSFSNPLRLALIINNKVHLHLRPSRLISLRTRRTLSLNSHNLRHLRTDLRMDNNQSHHSRRLLTPSNRARRTLPNKAGHRSMLHNQGRHTPNKSPHTPSRRSLPHNSRDPILPSKMFMLSLDHSPLLNNRTRNSRVLLIPNRASLNNPMLSRGNTQIPTRKLAGNPLRFTIRGLLLLFSQVKAPAAPAIVGSSITRCKWLAFSNPHLDRTVWRGVGSLRARTHWTHLPRCSSAPLLLITVTSSSSH